MIQTLFGLLMAMPVDPACPRVAIVVPEHQEITILDRQKAIEAERGCYIRYPNSPCVSKLQRYKDNDYTVVCTGTNTEEWTGETPAQSE